MIAIAPIPPTTPPAIAPVWDEGGLEAVVEGEDRGEETELGAIEEGLGVPADDDV